MQSTDATAWRKTAPGCAVCARLSLSLETAKELRDGAETAHYLVTLRRHLRHDHGPVTGSS